MRSRRERTLCREELEPGRLRPQRAASVRLDPLLFPGFLPPGSSRSGPGLHPCHAGAETSRQAGDQIFPQPAVCLSCHSGGKATNLDPARLNWSAPERIYRFDHGFHVRLGNLAPFLASAIDGGSYSALPISGRNWKTPTAAPPATGDSTPARPRLFPSCPTAWSATRRSTTRSAAATATWRG